MIVNRILSPSGDELAITYNGQGNAATVTKRTDSAAQKVSTPARLSNIDNRFQWVVQDYDGRTQSVSPSSATNLQAAWGSGYVTVLPAGSYVWTIRSSPTGYTFAMLRFNFADPKHYM